LDLSFNPGDLGNGATHWYEQPYHFMEPLPDGKVVIGWQGDAFSVPGGGSRLLRLDQDGWLDTTFLAHVTGSVHRIAVQADGKILVSQSGILLPSLIRLLPNGLPDSTFNSSNTFTGAQSSTGEQITYLKTLGNGDIIAGGPFTQVNGSVRRFVVRLDSTGTVLPAPYLMDPDIPVLMRISQNYRTMTVLNDGRVVICGSTSNGTSRGLMFTADGEYDDTFSFPPGWVDNLPSGDYTRLSATPDGGFLLCRQGELDWCRKINVDGTVDQNFELTYDANYQKLSVGYLPNGNILLTGPAVGTPGGNPCQGFLMADPQGNVLEDFPTDHLVRSFQDWSPVYHHIRAQAIMPDGKILLSSEMFLKENGSYGVGMVRLMPDGRIDRDFRKRTSANGPVNAAVIQADGRIVLGGEFTTYDGYPSRGLVRIHDDGTIDTTFNVGRGAGGHIMALVQQLDGSFIVGMKCSGTYFEPFYDTDSTASVMHIGADGSFLSSLLPVNTTTHGCDTILHSSASLERLTNGGLIAGGYGVMRFAPDLTTVPNYLGSGLSGSVADTYTMPDGKTYVGGSFAYYNGTPIPIYLARLSSSGAPDGWGGANIAGTSDLPGQVLDLEPLPSGTAFMVCGRIRRAYGTPLRQGLIQVTTDGLVTTFTSGFAYGSDDYCHKIKRLSTGDYLIGGRFSTYAGQQRNDLIRTNALGVLDPAFNAQGGLEPDRPYNVRVLDVDQYGRYLVAGDFLSYQGIGRNFILRLSGEGLPTDVPTDMPTPPSSLVAHVTQDDRLVVSNLFPEAELLQLFDRTGRLVLQAPAREGNTGIDVSALSEGIYLLRATFRERYEVTKFHRPGR
jgi:uncharacterized delta-60 repeat protein